MKKLLVLLVAATLFAGNVFAAGQQDSASGDAKMKIGFSISDLSNPVWVEMYNRMEEEADALGVELIVNDAKNDPNSQINAIENFIISGCKAMIIHAFNPESSASVIEDAMSKGIKVIAYDTNVEGTDGYCGVENYLLGTVIGKQAGEYINENFGGVAEVGLCEYPAFPIIVERANGIIDGLKETAPNATIVARATAGYVPEGVAVGENFMQAHPNIKVIAGINDGGILGVYEALKSAGLKDSDIGLFGCDATIDALNAIKEGGIYRGTVQLDTAGSGAVMVNMAYNAAIGEEYKHDFYMKMAAVDSTNIDTYLK